MAYAGFFEKKCATWDIAYGNTSPFMSHAWDVDVKEMITGPFQVSVLALQNAGGLPILIHT